MSFFGFDATLPRDRGHQAYKPGFGATPDAFAGLSGRDDDADALDFEDTYDGLGDRLDETDDAFNDDTFGSEPATQQNVAKDFDFSGQTAKIANTLQEEQMLYTARQPPPKASPPRRASKPARTGYENYAQPDYIPKLEANAGLWGIPPKKASPQPQVHQRQESQGAAFPAAEPSRRMMSLEEVEAAMRAQSKKPAATQPQIPQAPQSFPPVPPAQPSPAEIPHPLAFAGPPQILQRPQAAYDQRPLSAPRPPLRPKCHLKVFSILRFCNVSEPHNRNLSLIDKRLRSPPHSLRGRPPNLGKSCKIRTACQVRASRLHSQGHVTRGPSYPANVVTYPQQILDMTSEERAAHLEAEAKRAKRNYKIHLLSKDNGLMTPQDKNFITRIQLQQLVTATGGVDDQGPEAALAEDFYYQVYSQIRGAPRQNPNQPASQFAQTYLFQTGGRYGNNRRRPRGGDNHIQRMEQQVQRAVEAAKAKPKNKQLVIEGSLGKISFSNAKTPKPLLNIKRTESGTPRPESAARRPSHMHRDPTTADRKVVLRDIENVYSTLMQMEDHERHMPPPLAEDSEPAVVEAHMLWRQTIQSLNEKLWQELKVMEPIIPNSPTPHPFIAILSHSKGKKAVPRIFRHITDQQRITILTMIVVHLDALDVIRNAVPTHLHGIDQPIPASVREDIELFAQTVLPPFFAYLADAPLNIVTGLLGLVLDRTNITTVARTKIGLLVLTIAHDDWLQWTELYTRLFDAVEPVLPFIFPGSVNDAEDVYVWQFLAAMGVGASPEQQQRLVIGVKERVMETVGACRALPEEMRQRRLGDVNLFMRAIGLDVELLG
ncbi:DNA topoisomerase 2-associated protein pat1 [Coniosporium tulheliwenetii]|uniref:DNA topoisomerase 2-associated protein pat1 n=1 Tax=Coniosporium tulheliwenetii TaxID=3383036 RepID=A0ACC2ZAB2_9PEZI|nr:DNA topoisomerase 2-associated protein pat1 [Cladosporium sp. JES 115]